MDADERKHALDNAVLAALRGWLYNVDAETVAKLKGDGQSAYQVQADLTSRIVAALLRIEAENQIRILPKIANDATRVPPTDLPGF